MISAARREESVAAHGARWYIAATMALGFFNYLYALLLTHLLSVTSYSRFTAGQGLILWASTVATVGVPWMLAQALARARSDNERNSATRFAKLVSAGSGISAAIVTGGIATAFASTATAVVLAISTFIIFLGTTTTGWLQGNERMRTLSILNLVENLLKNGAGVVLVMVAGLQDTGALAAFGIGGIAMLVLWPRTPRSPGERWLDALSGSGLWGRAGRIAAAQGLVASFVAIDVVLVAILPGNRVLAASYQASASVSRIPLFIAGAVATAFFPSLSRRSTGGVIAARAMRMYAAAALPLVVVLATVPAPLLTAVFPAKYGAMAMLLRYTALTGLAAGGISLVTAFFQAADDYSCMWWLGGGLAGYVGGLMLGWRVDGIVGLAAGGAASAMVALTLMIYRLVRRQGSRVLVWVPLVEPVVATAVLVVLRPHVLLWLVAATVVGVRAAVRFLRPGARHARLPRWARSTYARTGEESAVSLLADAVWRGITPRANDAELREALELARSNCVEGRLARAYPAQLAGVLEEVRSARHWYVRNLHQVLDCLQRASVQAMLIQAYGPDNHAGTSFDLVVREQDWHRALAALADWPTYSSTYQLERSTTAVLYPSTGPGLHLHSAVCGFSTPVLPTARVLARARRSRHGFLVPAPPDSLRIWLAHALFQNLVLNLAELLAVCDLLRPSVIMAARAEARREGWLPGFNDALAAADAAIQRLDRGLSVSLPIPVPVSSSLAAEAKPANLRHQIRRLEAIEQQTALQALLAVSRRKDEVTR